MPLLRWVDWLSHLKVSKKIGLGYAISLGIAVSGTIAGFGVGHHYQQKAATREEHSRKEVELLRRLQTGVLQIRTHQQQLIPLAPFPAQFQEEYAHILVHQQQIQQSWTELRTFTVTQPNWLKGNHFQKIPQFLTTYHGIPNQYLQELAQQVQTYPQSGPITPAQVARTQASLLKFTNSDLALKFDGISDTLVDLIETSYTEVLAAEELSDRADDLAQMIMLGSMGLSIAIATLSAILTSRVIAQPIQALTQVAQRATEESNFDLQAVVKNQDEIGSLAFSFNQLIQAVKYLLDQQEAAKQQLAEYSQTLEEQVAARTQELSDKNHQLQDLLEQLRQSHIQMVQSEKMSSLGQLVAGVAHEINNPVNFIYGNLTYVQDYAKNLLDFIHLYQIQYPNPGDVIDQAAEEIDLEFLQADLPKLLNSMKVGTDRIRQIVLSLRNFSRMDEAEFKAIDIHEGLDSTLLILQHRLKARSDRPEIEVIRAYGSLPLVECYAGQLNQVFMNILANAVDAIDEQHAQRTPQEVQDHPNQIQIQTTPIDQGWVRITITDNGPGIPEAIQTQIFNPFFTTKAIGKGTGIGMAISYQIITEKHGGRIWCESTPGSGARFILELPIHQPNTASTKDAERDTSYETV